MKSYTIAIYPDPYKGGIPGPTIQADTLDAAQQQAEAMFPHAEVVAEEMA